MKLNVVLISIVLFSCNNYKQKQIRNKDSTVVKKASELAQTHIKFQHFDEYWEELGVAIQTNDTNKIKSLVEVPLIILGREDKDPEIKLNNGDIVKYVLYIVNNGGYYDFEKDTSISNRTLLLSNLKSIAEYDKYSDNQWIKDFVFKKTRQGWKLVIIYMDTKDLKNKLK